MGKKLTKFYIDFVMELLDGILKLINGVVVIVCVLQLSNVLILQLLILSLGVLQLSFQIFSLGLSFVKITGETFYLLGQIVISVFEILFDFFHFIAFFLEVSDLFLLLGNGGFLVFYFFVIDIIFLLQLWNPALTWLQVDPDSLGDFSLVYNF